MCHYDIDVNLISIDDWTRFCDNNTKIVSTLDSCCSNVADMIANVSSTTASVPSVNAALSQLKTVSMSPVEDVSYLTDAVNNINDYIKNKSLVICGGLYYGELAISSYNGKVDKDDFDLFQAILKGTADSNIYWILYESLKSGPLPAKALGFCLAYGTDAQYEGGSFVVGDAAAHLFKLATTDIIYFSDKTFPVWTNNAVGTAAVVIFTAVKEIVTHKGEWTTEEKWLVAAKAAEAGLSYFEWVTIAGAIGGVPGVVVAAVLAIPTTMLWDEINKVITGDNTIDWFERDGKKYEVTYNGKGTEGTFDMIVDKYVGSLEDYYIGERLVSEHEYKETMYFDFPDFIYQNTGEKVGELGEYFSGDTLQNALNQMAPFDTFEEAMDAYWDYLDEQLDGVDADILASNLIVDYGFNFEECYNYMHKRYEEGEF